MDATSDGGSGGGGGLLDTKGVALRLNIAERSVRTLVALGHLPKVDMAPLKKVRFHPADVEAFIESRRSRPKPTGGRSATPPPPGRRV